MKSAMLERYALRLELTKPEVDALIGLLQTCIQDPRLIGGYHDFIVEMLREMGEPP